MKAKHIIVFIIAIAMMVESFILLGGSDMWWAMPLQWAIGLLTAIVTTYIIFNFDAKPGEDKVFSWQKYALVFVFILVVIIATVAAVGAIQGPQ